MGSFFNSLHWSWEYKIRPHKERLLGIIAITVIAVALPLTVFISQQEQDIRQSAAVDCTPHTTTNPDTYESVITGCPSVCDPVRSSAGGPITSCIPKPGAGDTRCTDRGGSCLAENPPQGYEDIGELGCTPGRCYKQATQPFNCSGVQNLDGGDSEEYQCQLSESGQGYGCQSGWTQSQRLPNTCTNQGKYCCWKSTGSSGQQSSSVPDAGGTPPPAPPPPAGSLCQPGSYDYRFTGNCGCLGDPNAGEFSVRQCNVEGSAYGSEFGECRNLRAGDTCSVPPPPVGQPPPQATLPTRAPSSVLPTQPAAPTPTGTAPITCNENEITLSTSPATVTVGQPIAFNISGDASTFIGDDYSGVAVNCNGSWNNKTCTTNKSGTFQWTHVWQRCVGDFNHCSNVCRKTTNFTVVAPTPTPTRSSVNPTPTPTTTAQSPTNTPVPGGITLSLNLSLEGIGSSITTPQRRVSVELFNGADQSANQPKTGFVTYDASSKTFKGDVDMGTVSPNTYTVKIQTDRYLKKRAPGILNVTSSIKSYTIPQTQIFIGDINGDNKLDIVDYNILRDCGFGALTPKGKTDSSSLFNSPGCKAHSSRDNADLDDNGTIDSIDYNYFIRGLALGQGD